MKLVWCTESTLSFRLTDVSDESDSSMYDESSTIYSTSSTNTFCTVHLHVQGDNRIPAEYCL